VHKLQQAPLPRPQTQHHRHRNRLRVGRGRGRVDRLRYRTTISCCRVDCGRIVHVVRRRCVIRAMRRLCVDFRRVGHVDAARRLLGLYGRLVLVRFLRRSYTGENSVSGEIIRERVRREA
jgi:hypothetical protein